MEWLTSNLMFTNNDLCFPMCNIAMGAARSLFFWMAMSLAFTSVGLSPNNLDDWWDHHADTEKELKFTPVHNRMWQNDTFYQQRP